VMSTLALHVDSIEFSPHYPHRFVVGCYELDEETKKRNGGIQLMQIVQNELTHTQPLVAGPGVFDLKWFDSCLAVATSDGTVDFYQIDHHGLSNKKESVSIEGEAMALSVGWNVTGNQLSATFTNGAISVFDPRTLQPTWFSPEAHGNEVWSSRFDSVEPTILYSGADDCTFKAWDVRVPPSRPLWVNRSEMAGTTTFETSSRWPQVLMVGGYNEKVVAWDLRKPLKQELCSIGVDGGVWRIRSRTSDSLLAVAAMRGYFRVLDFDSTNLNLSCVGIQNEVHTSESLCYGIDWMPNHNVMVCGSFYDNKVSIWQLPGGDRD